MAYLLARYAGLIMFSARIVAPKFTLYIRARLFLPWKDGTGGLMMDREILFRGKRKDNGKWVYGYAERKINCAGSIWVMHCPPENPDDIYRMFDVVPETVGRYTGLTDKNGKKIFEDDIVKTKKYGKIIGHSNVNDYDIFKIIYVPAVFRLENHHRGFNLVGNGEDYEVIGNVHNNPELLGV